MSPKPNPSSEFAMQNLTPTATARNGMLGLLVDYECNPLFRQHPKRESPKSQTRIDLNLLKSDTPKPQI